tara:strand:- start:72 stop:350 length:279 start_codon:yes stop_codon:yes gene_type:complete
MTFHNPVLHTIGELTPIQKKCSTFGHQVKTLLSGSLIDMALKQIKCVLLMGHVNRFHWPFWLLCPRIAHGLWALRCRHSQWFRKVLDCLDAM